MKNTSVGTLIAASMLMSGGMFDQRPRKHKEPEIDLEAEYELIKAKKSKLSTNQRRSVVMDYEQKYGVKPI